MLLGNTVLMQIVGKYTSTALHRFIRHLPNMGVKRWSLPVNNLIIPKMGTEAKLRFFFFRMHFWNSIEESYKVCSISDLKNLSYTVCTA